MRHPTSISGSLRPLTHFLLFLAATFLADLLVSTDGIGYPELRGQSYDVLIRNGRIADGTTARAIPYRATIAIKDGRIISIERKGKLETATAEILIDAEGQIVAPGFIDPHMHVEGSLPKQPGAENLIRDGVTTVITGNCGGSSVDLDSWFADLETKGFALNVASLIGHNSVRRKVMQTENRPPTDGELAAMIALVEKAMGDGAVGLSTGLLYVPGAYAQTDEVIELAKAAARHGGVYATHMRDETTGISESISESIHIAREAGLPLQISHFKLAGKPMWGESQKALQAIREARDAGLSITMDQYPYTASSTSLNVLIPAWALAGGREGFKQRMANHTESSKIRQAMLNKEGRLQGWDHLEWAVVASCPWDESLNGKSIREINKNNGKPDTFEAQIETVLEMVGRAHVSMIYHMMNESDVRRIMANPFTMIGRDGGVHSPGNSKPHPRSYGAASRVLGRYVREENTLSLTEAVRKLSSMTAERFDLKERGKIVAGYWADLVLFDPDRIADRATFDDPHQYSTGITHVLVNGELVVRNGETTSKRPGKVLRKRGNVP